MKSKYFILVSCLVASGCAGSADDGSASSQNGVNVAVLSLEAARGSEPLKDAPAAEFVDRAREAFKNGTADKLGLRVYKLESPDASEPGLAARAHELGLSGKVAADPEEPEAIRFEAGNYELVRNKQSGSEFLADMSRFHTGQGVSRSALRPEHEYVDIARSYVTNRFGARAEHASLYPYKVWTYMNAIGGLQGPPDKEEAYQIAVFFNSSIDGIPVIGSGAKIGVHMTPQGETIAHRSSLRPVSGEGIVIPVDQLLSPEKARAIIESQMKGNTVNLEQYVLAREELGYYVAGRNSIQNWVAPYYAYFYRPREGVTSKALLRTIPALTQGDLLDVINKDVALDRARKEANLASTGELPEPD